VRVVERSKHLGFSPEAGDPFWVVRERHGQDLQRDITTELRVLGSIHLAHAAAANEGDNFVSAESSARSEGQN